MSSARFANFNRHVPDQQQTARPGTKCHRSGTRLKPAPLAPGTPPIRGVRWAPDALESGMVTINHLRLALPETPFGGVKDSGFGHEGGIEGLQVYMQSKFVSHLG